MLVQCPKCGETIDVRCEAIAINRLLRCSGCLSRLRIAEGSPLRLAEFRSHGLSFRGGQVRGLWTRHSLSLKG